MPGQAAAAVPGDPAVAAQAAAVAQAVAAANGAPAAAVPVAAAPVPAVAAPAAPAPAAQPTTPDPNAAQPAAFNVAAWKPKLPDGVQPFDQTKLSAVHGIVFNEKLSPEQKMQALVDFQVQTAGEQNKALDTLINQQRATDFEALKADPQFGGARLDRTTKEARDIMTAFFGAKGSKLIEAYGLDKNPDFVIALAKIRSVVSEDTIRNTVNAPPADPNSKESEMRALFPKSYDSMVAASKK